MENSPEEEIEITEIRPRFKIESKADAISLEEKINMGTSADDAPCWGKISHGFGTLHIPQDRQHYWSPQLTIHIEEHGKGSLIRGLYGPKPAVWTMFVFFYCVIGFGTLIIAVIGYSNWSLGKSGTLLWWVPLLMLVFLSLYLVAYFGKKMGHDQMVVLHKFLEKVIK